MEEDIVSVLTASGYANVEVVTRLAPAWSTQWMSEQARDKLRAYGIAPPGRQRDEDVAISCPRCASINVQRLSEFGSTACKALYQCSDCAEPFDYFKPI
jgi:ring-1,2-phenylacetyl-CoA epoxidase subunit PaaD